MGRMTRPPAVSCQPVSARAPTPSGRPQRLVKTTPADMESEESSPAPTPTRSKAAPALRTTRLTPKAAATAAKRVFTVGFSPRNRAARPTTKRGPTEPTTAATPPGSR
ncbi:hypothetical protein SNARM312S_02213 [Streptomyces narbonensis]